MQRWSLEELLPHAKPMILLSGWERCAGELSVDAFVDVSAASPFYDPSLKGVPSVVGVEYMAQTMAVLVGLDSREKGTAPRIGFLLGSRKYEAKIPAFGEGERYRVHAICTYDDEEFGAFDCQIADLGERVVATATLTAYRPDKPITKELLAQYL